MAKVSADTDVFTSDADGRVVVFFTARRVPTTSRDGAHHVATEILKVLGDWNREGWYTSVGGMFGDKSEPMIYETGFAHDVDIAGAFEAPNTAAAYDGVVLLQSAGWDRLFATEWTLGSREFQPVPSPERGAADAPWALFALWEWNDAWQASSQTERTEYDLECDAAFTADITSGVSIAGRHRLDAQSRWHHLGIWEAPTFGHITQGMFVHEKVADFKFTTSRHYVGRRRPAADYFGGIR